MTIANIDFETRSAANLKKVGASAYFVHPSTKVLCMAYCFDDEDVELWLPGMPFPPRLAEHIRAGGKLSAFNAAFEAGVFEYGLMPDDAPIPAARQWLCSAYLARIRGLPGDLATAAYALGGEQQKDSRGRDLIRICCIEPRALEATPEELQELYDYCMQDVRTERGLVQALVPATPDELELFWTSEIINARGVPVDLEFCQAATQYKDAEMAEINAQLSAMTDGEVPVVTAKVSAKEWILKKCPEAPELRDPKKKSGYSLDRSHLAAFADRDDLDDDVRYVVKLLQDGANTSVSKYATMQAWAEPCGGRVTGAFMAGAAHTGRFSSRGAQLHNLKRDVPKDYPEKMQQVYSRKLKSGVMNTLAGLLRPTIVAPDGKVLVGGDWSGIEARITPWLGGAEDVLDIFRDASRDLYVETAARMGYQDRQVGKVATLACGFGGRGNAFTAMAKNYGISVSKVEGDRYADAWRRANPWAQPLWTQLEKCAKRAILRPGERVEFGRHGIAFLRFGRWLCVLLPSGRVLYYLDPDVKEGKMGERIVYRKPQYVTPNNPKAVAETWGGKLCENIVQAVAADILREALVTLEAEGQLEVIGHVHDEILAEIEAPLGEKAEAYLHDLMVEVPAWAGTLPLAAETWHGERYA